MFNRLDVEFLVLPNGLHGELVEMIEKIEDLEPFRLEDLHVGIQSNGFAAGAENEVDLLLVGLGPVDIFIKRNEAFCIL